MTESVLTFTFSRHVNQFIVDRMAHCRRVNLHVTWQMIDPVIMFFENIR